MEASTSCQDNPCSRVRCRCMKSLTAEPRCEPETLWAHRNAKALSHRQLVHAWWWRPLETLHQCSALQEELQLRQRITGASPSPSTHGQELQMVWLALRVRAPELQVAVRARDEALRVKAVGFAPEPRVTLHLEAVDQHLRATRNDVVLAARLHVHRVARAVWHHQWHHGHPAHCLLDHSVRERQQRLVAGSNWPAPCDAVQLCLCTVLDLGVVGEQQRHPVHGGGCGVRASGDELPSNEHQLLIREALGLLPCEEHVQEISGRRRVQVPPVLLQEPEQEAVALGYGLELLLPEAPVENLEQRYVVGHDICTANLHDGVDHGHELLVVRLVLRDLFAAEAE
mmetsp:Transcript_56190/g.130872  ORF Transcript_56190/g.130872 Transcript_56190/m.130872 type:complete len:341 (-) Transcript_56190:674-1696(-)